MVGAGASAASAWQRRSQDGLVHEGLTREQSASADVRRWMPAAWSSTALSAQGYQQPVSQFVDTYADWQIAGEIPSLWEVVEQARPSVLLRLTGVSGLFNEPLVRQMAPNTAHDRSSSRCQNPTADCESDPAGPDHLDGRRGDRRDGQPFDDVEFDGRAACGRSGQQRVRVPGHRLRRRARALPLDQRHDDHRDRRSRWPTTRRVTMPRANASFRRSATCARSAWWLPRALLAVALRESLDPRRRPRRERPSRRSRPTIARVRGNRATCPMCWSGRVCNGRERQADGAR